MIFFFFPQHVKIFGMALQYAVLNDQAISLSAGMDAFFLRPSIDTVGNQSAMVDVSSIRGGSGGAITAISLDNAQLQSERRAYEKFVQRVLNEAASDISNTVLITSNVDMSSYGGEYGFAGIPAGFVSPSIDITGTLSQVNHVLKKIYYFAPNNTNGDVVMSIEARDNPHFDCVRVPKPFTARSPLFTEHKAGDSNDQNETASIRSSCASVVATKGFAVGYAHREIPIRVMHVNQPPEVQLALGSSFTTTVDFFLTELGVSVSDVDNSDFKGYTSFGFLQSAPISVTISTKHGRVSLPNRDDLSIFIGRGVLDSEMSFRGQIDIVNRALSRLEYVCRRSDGCGPQYGDIVTVIVSDDGFFGKGGPMSDTKAIHISFSS